MLPVGIGTGLAAAKDVMFGRGVRTSVPTSFGVTQSPSGDAINECHDGCESNG